jgi:hypothetical protein
MLDIIITSIYKGGAGHQKAPTGKRNTKGKASGLARMLLGGG